MIESFPSDSNQGIAIKLQKDESTMTYFASSVLTNLSKSVKDARTRVHKDTSGKYENITHTYYDPKKKGLKAQITENYWKGGRNTPGRSGEVNIFSLDKFLAAYVDSKRAPAHIDGTWVVPKTESQLLSIRIYTPARGNFLIIAFLL
jgi:hypothetical protein